MILAAVERGVIESVVGGFGRIVADRQVNEMLAIGQKKWPAMGGVLSAVEFGDFHRSSAAGADPHQAGLCTGREQDDAARSPCAATAKGRVRDDLGRVATDIDRLELAIGEETERVAVRRPERKNRVFAPSQLMRFK